MCLLSQQVASGSIDGSAVIEYEEEQEDGGGSPAGGQSVADGSIEYSVEARSPGGQSVAEGSIEYSEEAADSAATASPVESGSSSSSGGLGARGQVLGFEDLQVGREHGRRGVGRGVPTAGGLGVWGVYVLCSSALVIRTD